MSGVPENWEDYPSSEELEESSEESDYELEEVEQNIQTPSIDILLQVGKPVYERARKKLTKLMKDIDDRRDIDEREKSILKMNLAQQIYSSIPNPKDKKRDKRDKGRGYVRKAPTIQMTRPESSYNPATYNPKDITYEWKEDLTNLKDIELEKRSDFSGKRRKDVLKQRDEQVTDRQRGLYDLHDRSISEKVGVTTGKSAYTVGLTGDIRPEDEATSSELRGFVGRNIPPRDYSRMGSFARERGMGTLYLNPSKRKYLPLQVDESQGSLVADKKRLKRSRAYEQNIMREVEGDLESLDVSDRRQNLRLKRRRDDDFKKPMSLKTNLEVQRERDERAARIRNRGMILERNIMRDRRRMEEQETQRQQEKQEEQRRLLTEYNRIISRRQGQNQDPQARAMARMERSQRKKASIEARRKFFAKKRADMDEMTQGVQDMSIPTRQTRDFFQARAGPITELEREMSLIELQDEEQGIARPIESIRQEAIRRLQGGVSRGTRGRGSRGRGTRGRGTRGTRGRGTRGTRGTRGRGTRGRR